MIAQENQITENKGVKMAKLMLESKYQTEVEARWAYDNDPQIKVAIEKLKKRNAERGTPVITKI